MTMLKKILTAASLLLTFGSLSLSAITQDYKYSGVPIHDGKDAKKICPGVCSKADMEWQGTYSSKGLCLCQKNP